MSDTGDESGTKSAGTSPGESTVITEEHRRIWTDLNKHGKSKKAGQLRLSDLASAMNLEAEIKELPQENLKTAHSRRFQIINDAVDELLVKAAKNNSAYVSTLIEQDSSILNNPLYIHDQKCFRHALGTLKDEVCSYINILTSRRLRRSFSTSC